VTLGQAVRSVLIGIALVVAITTAILIWVASGSAVREGGLAAIASSIAGGLTSIAYVLVGALIELRRPGHRVGRLMIVAGPLYGLLVLLWAGAATVAPLLDERTVAILDVAGGAASWAGIALIAGWIPLLFPTGLLPGPGWRVPAALVGGLGTAGAVAGMFRPGPIAEGAPRLNPFGAAWWPPALDVLVGAVPLLLVALLVMAFAALATRFRSGSPVERLQVRWLLAGMAVVGAGFAGNLVEGLIRSDDGYFVTAVVFTIGILLIPVTIGIAILRYRLYDIDRVVSRTLSYAVITALLAAVFVGTNLALQGVLADATGASGTLTTAVATLVVAGLFQPIRRRVQAPIDRRFNRRRVDGERVAASFAGHLRDQVDLDRIRTDVVQAAEDAVAPAATGVWLRGAR
jgi:hypothetical protein